MKNRKAQRDMKIECIRFEENLIKYLQQIKDILAQPALLQNLTATMFNKAFSKYIVIHKKINLS